jgi:tetratricopeptide (TPR) repeat protein
MLSKLMNFRLCLLFVIAALIGCESNSERKIKLASNESLQTAGVQTAASVLQISPEEQRSIAVLYFENGTGDAGLDWLHRGLTDMLVADLAQSPYLNVATVKELNDIAQRLGKSTNELMDASNAAEVAREARVEIILNGRYYYEAESLRIDAGLYDVGTGEVIRQESVSGAGLESIFLMVDELSERVRNDLRGDLQTAQERGMKFAEMTQYLEAFRRYSQALVNMEKFLYADADSFFQQAIELDSTFAAAYLRWVQVKLHFGDIKAANYAVRQARRFADKLSEPDRLWLRLMEAQLTGDIEELLATMQEFLQFEPYDVETRMQMANLLFRLRNYDRAIQHYELILELDPSRKLVYNQLGYVYAQRGDFTTALKYLEKYAQLAPDEPNPYDSKGEILMMAGRLQEATTPLKTALAKRPSFYYSAMRLSEIYSELGDLKQALKYSDRWIAEAPSPKFKADAYVRRAALLWRFGRIKKAEKALQLAQKISPNLVAPVLMGGEMYKFIGDTLASQRLYQSYYDYHKDIVNEIKPDYFDVEKFLRFSMEADLPPQDLIQVVQALAAKEKPSLMREMYHSFLGVLYLRAKDYESAKKYFHEPSPEFLDALVRVPTTPRGEVWKYISEAIRLQPTQDSPDYTSCSQMVEVARKAGRKDLEVLARFLLAQYHGKYGVKEKLDSEYRDLGVPLEDHWRVIGPFENHSGFNHQFPPEETIDLSAVYQAYGREIRWQPATDGAYDGYVDLRTIFKRSAWAVGYGLVYVNSPDKRLVQLRVASDEASKLWLNDDLVWQAYRRGEAPLDNDIVTVVLRPGDNRLLIKVTNSVRDWGFYLRVTDEEGNGFSDLKFHPPTKAELEVADL